MNAKYILALILTLQVSMSLCDQPPQDLVDKYNEMRATFINRMTTAFGKLQATITESINGVTDADRRSALELYNTKINTIVTTLAKGVNTEADAFLENARKELLSWYQNGPRPYIGNYLDKAITRAKIVLDEFMPTQ